MQRISTFTILALLAATPAWADMTSNMSAAKGSNTAAEAADHSARDPAVSNLSTNSSDPTASGMHSETTNMGNNSADPVGTNIDSVRPRASAMKSGPTATGCNSTGTASGTHATSEMLTTTPPSRLPTDCSSASSLSAGQKSVRNAPTALHSTETSEQ